MRKGFSFVEIAVAASILLVIFAIVFSNQAPRSRSSGNAIEQVQAFGQMRRFSRAVELEVLSARRVLHPPPGESSNELRILTPHGEVLIGFTPDYDLYMEKPGADSSGRVALIVVKNRNRKLKLSRARFFTRAENLVEFYGSLDRIEPDQKVVEYVDAWKF